MGSRLPQFWLVGLATESIWSVCNELITWLLSVCAEVWCLALQRKHRYVEVQFLTLCFPKQLKQRLEGLINSFRSGIVLLRNCLHLFVKWDWLQIEHFFFDGFVGEVWWEETDWALSCSDLRGFKLNDCDLKLLFDNDLVPASMASRVRVWLRRKAWSCSNVGGTTLSFELHKREMYH